MTCLTPFIPSTVSGMSLVTGCAVMLTLTLVTQSSLPINSLERRLNSSFTGHAGVVSSRVKVTSPGSRMTRSLMKPQLTMSSPKSGSMTLRSASRTSASFEPSGAEVMEGEDSDAWRQGAGPRRRDHARPPTRRPSEEPGADADAAREKRARAGDRARGSRRTGDGDGAGGHRHRAAWSCAVGDARVVPRERRDREDKAHPLSWLRARYTESSSILRPAALASDFWISSTRSPAGFCPVV